MAVDTPPEPGQLPSTPVVEDRGEGTNHRTARLVAIVAGLLGAALALATPFLPVEQTTAELNWPQNGVLQSVDAPLIGYVATDLRSACRARRPPAWPVRRTRARPSCCPPCRSRRRRPSTAAC